MPMRGGGGMARGTPVAALRLPLAPSVTGNVPRGCPPPPMPLGGIVSTGRADSERRLTGERRGWDTQRLGATTCPRRPTPTLAAPRQEEPKGSAPQTGSLAPCRLRSGLVVVVMVAVPSPVDFPLGWTQEPDSLCGRRVSIRPQPTRALCGEVMAPGPSWGGDPTRALAGGPTPVWGGGGMARDLAAAALRLSLALGVARGVPGSSPPPPPRVGSGRGPGRRGAPPNQRPAGMERGAARCNPLPPLQPPPPRPLL